LIGTMMGAVHLLPGTTFSTVSEKGSYAAQERASLTLPELERWLALQIAGVYHLSIHSASRGDSSRSLADRCGEGPAASRSEYESATRSRCSGRPLAGPREAGLAEPASQSLQQMEKCSFCRS
jgi:hypothetical protein